MQKLIQQYQKYSNSLPARASSAVMIIASLMILSAVISGFLAWTAERDAQAVNTAGSLRMATYRISFMLADDYAHFNQLDDSITPNHQSNSAQLSSDMTAKLDFLMRYETSTGNQDSEILKQLQEIRTLWQTKLTPTLTHNQKDEFYFYAKDYINRVDNLVLLIQLRNEQRQATQQFFQLVMLVISMIVMMAGLYELHQNVLIPIKKLNIATKQVKRSQGFQVSLSGYDELNELADAFNDMSHTIAKHKTHLQSEVARKTHHLTQSNQALALLFEFAKHINTQTLSFSKLQALIDEFAKLLPHTQLTLCLNSEISNHKGAVALHSKQQGSFCEIDNCAVCDIKHDKQVVIYPITNQDIEFGELMAQQLADTWQPSTSRARGQIPTLTLHEDELFFESEELLKTLANLIAMALSEQSLRQKEHELILVQERTAIARELHDSLAQSLTYLKFELSVLSKALEANHTAHSPNAALIQEKINNLKQGISGAYSQMRELLQTFRLKIDGDFDSALQNACDEFSAKGKFNITLDNRIMAMNLTANEQIDVIQIIREALSNIHKHAHANNVVISLTQDSTSKVCLSVIDDGVGIDFNFNPEHHHGLKIMKERTANLNGDLQVDNIGYLLTTCPQKALPLGKSTQGTQLSVVFLPHLFF